MTPTNLAVVFGPTLLKPTTAEAELDFRESAYRSAVIEFIIKNYEYLFSKSKFEFSQEQPSESITGVTDNHIDKTSNNENVNPPSNVDINTDR